MTIMFEFQRYFRTIQNLIIRILIIRTFHFPLSNHHYRIVLLAVQNLLL